MSPDIYGGENFNAHIPQWKCYFEDDKESNINSGAKYFLNTFINQ